MRDDMYKVIVERPRRLHSNAYKSDGRIYRNNETSPVRLGMKKGYDDRKWLNENLAPLERYLARQVIRSWNKVYSDIRASINPRSTVQQHILQHLEDFVAIRTKWQPDGRKGRVMVLESSWSGRYIPLEESSMKLFVHPMNGLLLLNSQYKNWKARKRQEAAVREEQKTVLRKTISARVQLHCIDGLWYEVILDLLPMPSKAPAQAGLNRQKQVAETERWDVLRKQWVVHPAIGKASDVAGYIEYGCDSLYAISKRQLNSHELKKYRLTQSASNKKGPAGPFVFSRIIQKAFNSVRNGIACDLSLERTLHGTALFMQLLMPVRSIGVHTAAACLRRQQFPPASFAPK